MVLQLGVAAVAEAMVAAAVAEAMVAMVAVEAVVEATAEATAARNAKTMLIVRSSSQKATGGTKRRVNWKPNQLEAGEAGEAVDFCNEAPLLQIEAGENELRLIRFTFARAQWITNLLQMVTNGPF